MMHEPGDGAIFPRFAQEQLGELAGYGAERRYGAGESLFANGDTVDSFFVVLEGSVRIERAGQVVATHPPGEFTGGLAALTGQGSRHSATAASESVVLEIPASGFQRLSAERPELGQVFISTLGQRMRESQAWIRQREKLAALGKLSAGLAHELNNPAAAAKSAAKTLREEILRSQESSLAHDARFSEGARSSLRALLRESEDAPQEEVLDTLERGDKEDEIALWLEDRGVEEAWDLSPTLVAAGLGVEHLEGLAGEPGGEALVGGVSWLGATLNLAALSREIGESATRISELVKAMKEYSHMDRAAAVEVDVRKGLESTLKVLGHKIKEGSIQVEREYEEGLPKVCGHGGELNQVWTNLVDNALDAMEGSGRLGVRAATDGNGSVVVEISDTGPGIPKEVRDRIFEPFFTTKGVGDGTGLGLDIVRRIIVEGHGGDVRVDSGCGGTRFRVQLPIDPPDDARNGA